MRLVIQMVGEVLKVSVIPLAVKAMLALKHRWRERGPLKLGEMQVETPGWMKRHPDYKHTD